MHYLRSTDKKPEGIAQTIRRYRKEDSESIKRVIGDNEQVNENEWVVEFWNGWIMAHGTLEHLVYWCNIIARENEQQPHENFVIELDFAKEER